MPVTKIIDYGEVLGKYNVTKARYIDKLAQTLFAKYAKESEQKRKGYLPLIATELPSILEFDEEVAEPGVLREQLYKKKLKAEELKKELETLNFAYGADEPGGSDQPRPDPPTAFTPAGIKIASQSDPEKWDRWQLLRKRLPIIEAEVEQLQKEIAAGPEPGTAVFFDELGAARFFDKGDVVCRNLGPDTDKELRELPTASFPKMSPNYIWHDQALTKKIQELTRKALGRLTLTELLKIAKDNGVFISDANKTFADWTEKRVEAEKLKKELEELEWEDFTGSGKAPRSPQDKKFSPLDHVVLPSPRRNRAKRGEREREIRDALQDIEAEVALLPITERMADWTQEALTRTTLPELLKMVKEKDASIPDFNTAVETEIAEGVESRRQAMDHMERLAKEAGTTISPFAKANKAALYGGAEPTPEGAMRAQLKSLNRALATLNRHFQELKKYEGQPAYPYVRARIMAKIKAVLDTHGLPDDVALKEIKRIHGDTKYYYDAFTIAELLLNAATVTDGKQKEALQKDIDFKIGKMDKRRMADIEAVRSRTDLSEDDIDGKVRELQERHDKFYDIMDQAIRAAEFEKVHGPEAFASKIDVSIGATEDEYDSFKRALNVDIVKTMMEEGGVPKSVYETTLSGTTERDTSPEELVRISEGKASNLSFKTSEDVNRQSRRPVLSAVSWATGTALAALNLTYMSLPSALFGSVQQASEGKDWSTMGKGAVVGYGLPAAQFLDAITGQNGEFVKTYLMETAAWLDEKSMDTSEADSLLSPEEFLYKYRAIMPKTTYAYFGSDAFRVENFAGSLALDILVDPFIMWSAASALRKIGARAALRPWIKRCSAWTAEDWKAYERFLMTQPERDVFYWTNIKEDPARAKKILDDKIAFFKSKAAEYEKGAPLDGAFAEMGLSREETIQFLKDGATELIRTHDKLFDSTGKLMSAADRFIATQMEQRARFSQNIDEMFEAMRKAKRRSRELGARGPQTDEAQKAYDELLNVIKDRKLKISNKQAAAMIALLEEAYDSAFATDKTISLAQRWKNTKFKGATPEELEQVFDKVAVLKKQKEAAAAAAGKAGKPVADGEAPKLEEPLEPVKSEPNAPEPAEPIVEGEKPKLEPSPSKPIVPEPQDALTTTTDHVIAKLEQEAARLEFAMTTTEGEKIANQARAKAIREKITVYRNALEKSAAKEADEVLAKLKDIKSRIAAKQKARDIVGKAFIDRLIKHLGGVSHEEIAQLKATLAMEIFDLEDEARKLSNRYAELKGHKQLPDEIKTYYDPEAVPLGKEEILDRRLEAEMRSRTTEQAKTKSDIETAKTELAILVEKQKKLQVTMDEIESKGTGWTANWLVKERQRADARVAQKQAEIKAREELSALIDKEKSIYESIEAQKRQPLGGPAEWHIRERLLARTRVQQKQAEVEQWVKKLAAKVEDADLKPITPTVKPAPITPEIAPQPETITPEAPQVPSEEPRLIPARPPRKPAGKPATIPEPPKPADSLSELINEQRTKITPSEFTADDLFAGMYDENGKTIHYYVDRGTKEFVFDESGDMIPLREGVKAPVAVYDKNGSPVYRVNKVGDLVLKNGKPQAPICDARAALPGSHPGYIKLRAEMAKHNIDMDIGYEKLSDEQVTDAFEYIIGLDEALAKIHSDVLNGRSGTVKYLMDSHEILRIRGSIESDIYSLAKEMQKRGLQGKPGAIKPTMVRPEVKAIPEAIFGEPILGNLSDADKKQLVEKYNAWRERIRQEANRLRKEYAERSQKVIADTSNGVEVDGVFKTFKQINEEKRAIALEEMRDKLEHLYAWSNRVHEEIGLGKLDTAMLDKTIAEMTSTLPPDYMLGKYDPEAMAVEIDRALAKPKVYEEPGLFTEPPVAEPVKPVAPKTEVPISHADQNAMAEKVMRAKTQALIDDAVACNSTASEIDQLKRGEIQERAWVYRNYKALTNEWVDGWERSNGVTSIYFRALYDAGLLQIARDESGKMKFSRPGTELLKGWSKGTGRPSKDGVSKIIRHYTYPENVQKILEQGYKADLPPVHGTGALEGGTKTGKAAGEVLYFTTDGERWSTAEVYVGEGKGDISRRVFDYDAQTWVEEKNAYRKVSLAPVEAIVKANAKMLVIDSWQAALDAGIVVDRFDFMQNAIKRAKELGYDILNIQSGNEGAWYHPKGKPSKSGNKSWYSELTGSSGKDDYFVLNRDAIDLLVPEKAAPKPVAEPAKPVTPEVKPETGAVKEPWQKTAKQYSKEDTKKIMTDAGMVRNRDGGWNSPKWDHEVSEIEYYQIAEEQHRVSVLKAVSEGKAVDPAIVMDAEDKTARLLKLRDDLLRLKDEGKTLGEWQTTRLEELNRRLRETNSLPAEPVKPVVAPGAGAVKEPWQMTKEEYKAFRLEVAGRAPKGWQDDYTKIVERALAQGKTVAPEIVKQSNAQNLLLPHELTLEQHLSAYGGQSERLTRLVSPSGETYAIITYPHGESTGRYITFEIEAYPEVHNADSVAKQNELRVHHRKVQDNYANLKSDKDVHIHNTDERRRLLGDEYVNHHEAVAKAIAEGKEVPPEVLADYPEFVKGKPVVAPEAGAVKPNYINREEFDFISRRQAFSKLSKSEQVFILEKLDRSEPVLSLTDAELETFNVIDQKIGHGGKLPKRGKEFWEMTRREFVDNMGGAGRHSDLNLLETHRENVVKALDEGKPVPPEVLADYPELVKGKPVVTPPPEPKPITQPPAESPPTVAKKFDMYTHGETGYQGTKVRLKRPGEPEQTAMVYRVSNDGDSVEIILDSVKEAHPNDYLHRTMRVGADDLEVLEYYDNGVKRRTPFVEPTGQGTITTGHVINRKILPEYDDVTDYLRADDAMLNEMCTDLNGKRRIAKQRKATTVLDTIQEEKNKIYKEQSRRLDTRASVEIPNEPIATPMPEGVQAKPFDEMSAVELDEFLVRNASYYDRTLRQMHVEISNGLSADEQMRQLAALRDERFAAREALDYIERDLIAGIDELPTKNAIDKVEVPLTPEEQARIKNIYGQQQKYDVLSSEDLPPEIQSKLTVSIVPDETGIFMNIDDITMDEDIFQWRAEKGAGLGVTAEGWSFRDSSPIHVWYGSTSKDPNPKVYIINGHTRFNNALNINRQAQKVGVKGVPKFGVVFVKAKDAEEAIWVGALINLRQGSGSVIDFGTYFRKIGMRNMGTAQLHKLGIPVNRETGKLVKQALAIADLSDEMFAMLKNGALRDILEASGKNPEDVLKIMCAIGDAQLDAAQQKAIFKIIARSKKGYWTTENIIDLVAEGRKSQTVAVPGQGGWLIENMDDTTLSLLEHRVDIKAAVRKKLAQRKSDLAAGSRTRTVRTLEDVGDNVIDVAANQTAFEQAERVKSMFDLLSDPSREGPVNAVINEAAIRVHEGDSLDKVSTKISESLRVSYDDLMMKASLDNTYLIDKVFPGNNPNAQFHLLTTDIWFTPEGKDFRVHLEREHTGKWLVYKIVGKEEKYLETLPRMSATEVEERMLNMFGKKGNIMRAEMDDVMSVFATDAELNDAPKAMMSDREWTLDGGEVVIKAAKKPTKEQTLFHRTDRPDGMLDASGTIHLTAHADIETLLHEFGHKLESIMSPELRKEFMKLYGIDDIRAWTTEHSERFANDFVRYVYGGTLKSPIHEAIFDELRYAILKARSKSGELLDMPLLSLPTEQAYFMLASAAEARDNIIQAVAYSQKQPYRKIAKAYDALTAKLAQAEEGLPIPYVGSLMKVLSNFTPFYYSSASRRLMEELGIAYERAINFKPQERELKIRLKKALGKHNISLDDFLDSPEGDLFKTIMKMFPHRWKMNELRDIAIRFSGENAALRKDILPIFENALFVEPERVAELVRMASQGDAYAQAFVMTSRQGSQALKAKANSYSVFAHQLDKAALHGLDHDIIPFWDYQVGLAKSRQNTALFDGMTAEGRTEVLRAIKFVDHFQSKDEYIKAVENLYTQAASGKTIKGKHAEFLGQYIIGQNVLDGEAQLLDVAQKIQNAGGLSSFASGAKKYSQLLTKIYTGQLDTIACGEVAWFLDYIAAYHERLAVLQNNPYLRNVSDVIASGMIGDITLFGHTGEGLQPLPIHKMHPTVNLQLEDSLAQMQLDPETFHKIEIRGGHQYVKKGGAFVESGEADQIIEEINKYLNADPANTVLYFVPSPEGFKVIGLDTNSPNFKEWSMIIERSKDGTYPVLNIIEKMAETNPRYELAYQAIIRNFGGYNDMRLGWINRETSITPEMMEILKVMVPEAKDDAAFILRMDELFTKVPEVDAIKGGGAGTRVNLVENGTVQYGWWVENTPIMRKTLKFADEVQQFALKGILANPEQPSWWSKATGQFLMRLSHAVQSIQLAPIAAYPEKALFERIGFPLYYVQSMHHTRNKVANRFMAYAHPKIMANAIRYEARINFWAFEVRDAKLYAWYKDMEKYAPAKFAKQNISPERMKRLESAFENVNRRTQIVGGGPAKVYTDFIDNMLQQAIQESPNIRKALAAYLEKIGVSKGEIPVGLSAAAGVSELESLRNLWRRFKLGDPDPAVQALGNTLNDWINMSVHINVEQDFVARAAFYDIVPDARTVYRYMANIHAKTPLEHTLRGFAFYLTWQRHNFYNTLRLTGENPLYIAAIYRAQQSVQESIGDQPGKYAPYIVRIGKMNFVINDLVPFFSAAEFPGIVSSVKSFWSEQAEGGRLDDPGYPYFGALDTISGAVKTITLWSRYREETGDVRQALNIAKLVRPLRELLTMIDDFARAKPDQATLKHALRFIGVGAETERDRGRRIYYTLAALQSIIEKPGAHKTQQVLTGLQRKIDLLEKAYAPELNAFRLEREEQKKLYGKQEWLVKERARINSMLQRNDSDLFWYLKNKHGIDEVSLNYLRKAGMDEDRIKRYIEYYKRGK